MKGTYFKAVQIILGGKLVVQFYFGGILVLKFLIPELKQSIKATKKLRPK